MPRITFVSFAFLCCAELVFGQDKKRPEFQYDAGDIRVVAASESEPRVERFGAESLQAAKQYLEDGAIAWVRGRACVNCHTTGPYLADRTAWIDKFGKPNTEVYENFVKAVPEKIQSVEAVESKGHRFHPNAHTSVWRSLGLAQWDKYVTGQTLPVTDRSLRDMFERQSDSGAFVSHGEVEIPHITTDFELTLQAARAITAAPQWLASVTDEQLLQKIDKLKRWLRESAPQNDFDRVLKLQLGAYFPELLSDKERESAIALLVSKQHADGGWSTRDFSELDRWHFEISPYVRKLVTELPDAEAPESDAYMTALAIVLLRQANVATQDPHVKSGLAWLRREQRQSGRWWMQSLYRGNYNYITYIATIEAVKAFDLCGELEPSN